MPRWLKFAGLWSLSVLVALALSWVAVSQVRDRVIQPVAVIPTTIAALDPEPVAPTVVVVEPDREPGSDDPVDTMPSQPATTSTTTPASTSTRALSTTSGSTASSTTSTTAAQGSTTVPTTTTTLGSSGLVTTSHSVPGGSVTIRSVPGQVYFVSAIPQPGFTTELRDQGPERVRVRFVSASLISEFEAEWDDGELEISSEEHSPDD